MPSSSFREPSFKVTVLQTNFPYYGFLVDDQKRGLHPIIVANYRVAFLQTRNSLPLERLRHIPFTINGQVSKSARYWQSA
jgi:hypothetical protein